jgi:hypothetical protein
MGPGAKRSLWIAAAVVGGLLLIVGIASLIYWQSLKSTPQYSLALLAHAARVDDQQAIAELVDLDAVVASMFPQVVNKAVEMYAAGLPIADLANRALTSTSIMPRVKERAAAEMPEIVRGEAHRIPNVPFPLMVIGARFYLEVNMLDPDTAVVTSRDPEHPTEVTMKRDGDRWKIVAVKDDKLANKIARKVGNEIISMIVNIRTEGTGNRGVDLLLRQLQRATP